MQEADVAVGEDLLFASAALLLHECSKHQVMISIGCGVKAGWMQGGVNSDSAKM